LQDFAARHRENNACFITPVLVMIALHQGDTGMYDVPMMRVKLLQTISNHRPQVIGDFDKLTEGTAVEVDVIEGPDGYEATCVVPL